MKKVAWMLMSLLLLLAVATGCTTNAATAPSPSPTVAGQPEGTAAPSATTGTQEQVEVLRTVGEEAQISVGTNKVNGAAYYLGMNDNTILFPLAEVGKALGWDVDETNINGDRVTLKKNGAEEIIIEYTRRTGATGTTVENKTVANTNNTNGQVIALEGITVTKAGAAVDIGNETLIHVDGKLYASEGFINKAMEQIAVNYDGKTSIIIESKS